LLKIIVDKDRMNMNTVSEIDRCNLFSMYNVSNNLYNIKHGCFGQIQIFQAIADAAKIEDRKGGICLLFSNNVFLVMEIVI
jgi:hypothetical protein